MTLKKQIEKVICELADLRDVSKDPEIMARTKTVLSERGGKIRPLQDELLRLRAQQQAEKNHQTYWSGTEESRLYRIHGWNSKGIVTSYPGHSYSTGQSPPVQAGWFLFDNAGMEARREAEADKGLGEPHKLGESGFRTVQSAHREIKTIDGRVPVR